MNLKHLPTKAARMAAYAAKQKRQERKPKHLKRDPEPAKSLFRMSMDVLQKAFCLK